MTSNTRFRQSMDDLPDELAEKVISYSDPTTIYHCLFSSRRIYRIAHPLLYRMISHRMYSEPFKLQAAIKTLIRKPELKNKVHTIILRDPQQNDSFWDMKSWKSWASINYNAVVNDEDHSLFMSATRAVAHGGRPPSSDDIKDREEAQAALLISLAPGLKTLHIENPTSEDETPRFVLDHLILTSLYPNIKEGLLLQNLTTLHAVTSRLEGGQGGFRLSSVATFFLLPNLRKVVGVACFEPEDDLYKPFDCPIGESNVVDLRFVRSSICPIGFSEMLKSCKALEVFDSDWAGVSVGWVEVNFPRLQEALDKHQSSLKKLRIDTRKHYASWPERDDGLVPPLGSQLKHFTALTKVDVPASALVGWDEDHVGGYDSLSKALPPNIEELQINEYAPRLEKDLEDFATVCTAEFANLRHITIARLNSEVESDIDIEDQLMQRFHELAPEVTISFDDGSEIDHFEGSVGTGSI